MWVIAFITLNRGLVPLIRILGITFTSFAVFPRKETNIAARHICTLYPYTNIYVPRFSQLRFFRLEIDFYLFLSPEPVF